jgi:hypothetical protein
LACRHPITDGDGAELEINPCICKAWDGFGVRQFRGAEYLFEVKTPSTFAHDDFLSP